MPKHSTDGVRFSPQGMTIYFTTRWKGGPIRFGQVAVPWSHFDDSEAWALYSRNARERAESDGDGPEEPSLPLDWT